MGIYGRESIACMMALGFKLGLKEADGGMLFCVLKD